MDPENEATFQADWWAATRTRNDARPGDRFKIVCEVVGTLVRSNGRLLSAVSIKGHGSHATKNCVWQPLVASGPGRWLYAINTNVCPRAVYSPAKPATAGTAYTQLQSPIGPSALPRLSAMEKKATTSASYSSSLPTRMEAARNSFPAHSLRWVSKSTGTGIGLRN